MEFTFNFTVWFAIMLIALIIICGAVTAIVFRRITTRYQRQIDQLQHRG
jgi:hypothetical protein